MLEEIRALEMQMHDPSVRASPQRLEELLAEDFVELGSSGRVFDKERVIARLPQEGPVEISIRDFRLGKLAPEVVLATYRARVRRGDEVTFSLRSSIGVLREGRWRIRFHQGSPARGEDERS